MANELTKEDILEKVKDGEMTMIEAKLFFPQLFTYSDADEKKKKIIPCLNKNFNLSSFYYIIINGDIDV